jgi:SAM-dependent methyltransferase
MEQRFTFDQAASVYGKARPDYPDALIDDVVSYAELKPTDRIFEVGCGTGQATKGFARRGFTILATDPGPEMLRGARESLAGLGKVEFLETTFEEWAVERAAFRLIIAAQSWHWVSPEARFSKAAKALSRGGSLAVLATFRWDCRRRYSTDSGKSISVRSANGVRRPRPGTYQAALSKDGLTNQVCSIRWSIEAIPGNGGTMHRAMSIFCARSRTTG